MISAKWIWYSCTLKVCLARETVMIRCTTHFWECKLEVGNPWFQQVLALAYFSHQAYLSGPIVCNVILCGVSLPQNDLPLRVITNSGKSAEMTWNFTTLVQDYTVFSSRWVTNLQLTIVHNHCKKPLAHWSPIETQPGGLKGLQSSRRVQSLGPWRF